MSYILCLMSYVLCLMSYVLCLVSCVLYLLPNSNKIMDIPQDFFTPESMFTLTGATTATFIMANGIQHAFNYNPKWLALIIALIISLAGVYFSGGTAANYFVGFINGFLVYASTVGIVQMLGSSSRPSTADVIDSRKPEEMNTRGFETTTIPAPKRTFFSPWY